MSVETWGNYADESCTSYFCYLIKKTYEVLRCMAYLLLAGKELEGNNYKVAADR